MKRTYRRFVATGVVLGVFVSSLAVQQPDTSEAAAKSKAKVSSVKITNVKKKKVTLVQGKTFKLKTKVKVKPNKAKFKKVTYRSSNKKIVSVNKKGKLKALKKGKAKITVTSKTNKKKKITITVTVKSAPAANKGENVNVTPTPSPTTVVTVDSTPTASPTPYKSPTPSPTPTPVPTELPDGTSTLMRKPFAEQAYVGATLSDVAIKSGFISDSNGNAIPGSYVWEKPTTTLSENGKTHHKAKFVPTDSKFATVEHISIPVLTIKNQVIVTKPSASGITTGKKLSASVLSGGSAKDAAGKAVAGKFSWADGNLVVKTPGKSTYAAVFTPNDTTKYRRQLVYVKVTATGNEIIDETEKKTLDLSGGNWKNNEAYKGQWNGTFYNLTPYLAGLDMSKYTKLTVEANAYDVNNKKLTDTTQSYIGFKLSEQEGDWWGFADAYVNSKATLSLGGYSGNNLYLVVQNMQASVAYIEITSITLETGSLTNVNDGSTLKLAFGDIFGKVGNVLDGFQVNNKECTNFLKTHYNSVTMGNEMKPDALLGGTPKLATENPSGYVDTSTFVNKYKDSQYPQINLSSLDNYMNMAYNNGLKMRFHVFVWHQQTPKWFFKKNFNEEQGWVTPEVMSGRLEYYIRNVMTYIFNYQNAQGVYVGREVIDNWDMANEYTNNADNDYKSYWDEVYYPDYKFVKDKHSGILNPVYIKKAFAIGHSILEDYNLTDKISLTYNDYNTYMAADKIIQMIYYFNTKDEINPNAEIICDGVGTQMHMDVTFPTIRSLETNCINKFMEAGIEIQPTEMDITDKSNTETSQQNQMKFWYNLMMLLMDKKDKGAKITGVVWWGLADDCSWRRDGIPLLFSKKWQAKEHYFNVIDAASSYSQGDTGMQR